MHDTHHISTRPPALCHSRKRRPHPVLTLLLLTALGWAAAVSCTKDVPEGKDGIIVFSSTAGTKALVNNPEDMSDIAVWGYNYETGGTGGTSPVFTAVRVYRDPLSGEWNYDDTRYWVPGLQYDFLALHPFDAAATELYEATLDEGNAPRHLVLTNYDITAEDDAREPVDLMIAVDRNLSYNPDDPAGRGPVNLDFKHLLAQVKFVAVKDPAMNGIPGFEPVVHSAALTGLPRYADFSSEKFDPSSTASIIDCWNLNKDGHYEVKTDKSSTANNNGVSIFAQEIMVYPQRIGNTITFSVTYSTDGNEENAKTQTVSLNTLSMFWEAGRHYTYTFTITNSDYILFSPPTVTPWDDASGGIIVVE